MAKPIVSDDRLAVSPLPRLYVYDHCPFCVRVRVLLGYKKIKHQLFFLANDEVDLPTSLVGRKVVPIWETGHTGKRVVMPESSDICHNIDNDASFNVGGPVLKQVPSNVPPSVAQTIRSVQPHLAYPRTCAAANLAEFQFAAARETFKVRHPMPCEPTDYDEAYRQTPKYLPVLNKALAELENYVASDTHIHPDGFGNDDLVWFATLRLLTLVKGAEFGPTTLKYLHTMSKLCDIPLFFGVAS